MTFTLVSFHAHPDDEALLTGGTLARAAAEGHRVVLVVATAGEAGLTADGTSRADLGARRLAELAESARALGCARVECLGDPDSGFGGPAQAGAFSEADLDEAAGRLAAILREERADVLTTYDAAGGYGHPDHVQVHRVGRRAAELAGTPSVLEATIDRTALLRVLRVLARVPGVPVAVTAEEFRDAYTPRTALTHRVDVRAFDRAKRAALSAHATQATGGADTRTVAMLLRLPGPLFRAALGREWFLETGRTPGEPLCGDIFDTVRRAPRPPGG
jgi:LmbE family N-acetylglucosaminyl deacetylase